MEGTKGKTEGHFRSGGVPFGASRTRAAQNANRIGPFQIITATPPLASPCSRVSPAAPNS